MSQRYSPSGTIRLLYALGLVAWLLWMIRLQDACNDPGLWRCLFPAIGFLIAAFLAIVFCLDRDARRRAGLPVEPVASKDNQAMIRRRLEYGDKRTNSIWSWRWRLLFIALGLAVPAAISFLPIWPARFCANNVVHPPPSPTMLWQAGYFSFCE